MEFEIKHKEKVRDPEYEQHSTGLGSTMRERG